jgi:hypothetical protein
MPVESPEPSAGWNCANDALAEIRAASAELQTLLGDTFDELELLADELQTQELTCRYVERDALQGQIDRLASVASELAASVAEQKQWAGQKRNRG